MRLIIGASVFALCAGGAIYYQYEIQEPPAQYGVGLDNSASMRPDCNGLARQVQALMTKANGARDGSKLSLFTIGKTAVNPSPLRIFDEAMPAGSSSIMSQAEGDDGKQTQAYFSGFRHACEIASQSEYSPVLRLVIDGIADLRSRAKQGARKFLIVQSDLMDDVDPSLRALLARARRHPDLAASPDLAGSINNEGTNVIFCGVSQTASGDRRGPLRPETLQRIYLQLFTRPDLVSFRPFCGE